MKKFLVMLMVVAMASFLFVGCLPGVTPPEPEPEPEPEPVVPTTVAPIIIAQDAGALVNKAEAANGIIVNGTGRTYAEIKVSIDGVLVSSGDVAVNGTWIVVIAKTELGADGAKVLTATATEPGLAESAKSNEVKFTLDTVIPGIKKSSAIGSTQEVVKRVEETAAAPDIEDLFDNWTITDPTIAIGLWDITFVIADNDGDLYLSYGDTIVFTITSPTAVIVATTYTYTNHYQTWTLIPGLTVRIPDYDVNDPLEGLVAALNPAGVAGVGVNIYTRVQGKDRGYIDVTFDEDVTSASILSGPWSVSTNWWVATSPTGWFTVSAKSAAIARISSWNLDTGDIYAVSCYGISDLAGNKIPATSPASSTGAIGAVLP